MVNALLPLKLLQRLHNLETLIGRHMNRMEYVFEFVGPRARTSCLDKVGRDEVDRSRGTKKHMEKPCFTCNIT